MKAPSPKSPRLLAKVSSCASSQISLWKTRIENCDAHALWRALHRLVTVHPLVRSALSSQQSSANSTHLFSLQDLTQELYLLLLQKGRFNHYLDSQMTDTEIEREIFQIELTNLLIGSLRRRRPENYRIVRRVSGVLENDPHFRRFRQREGQTARYRQAAEAIYGLRKWNDQKVVKDSGTFSDLIAGISMRMRDRRRAGCTGEAQVIISSQELTELMIEIFDAIDSPASLRVLRQLALSKLPVYDPVMTALEDEVNEERQGRSYHDSIASSEASPELIALRDEQEEQARLAAAYFLDHLSLLVRSNARRTERLWRVLWHCYFDPVEPSQLEIAEMVGISDSSVSDYRRKLEAEMRKLEIVPEQLRHFAEELDEQLRWRLSLTEKDPPHLEFDSKLTWLQYSYNSLRIANCGLRIAD
ncbi:MAG: hypothetical protein L0226_05590 [Acidobacteria bacterium]|nr:hypothetical protein [Acidobacteriota bacterium]